MKCANCKQREGTIAWTGEGGTLDYIHGFYSMWCELCATRAQLEHARKEAERIPELEKRLRQLQLEALK